MAYNSFQLTMKSLVLRSFGHVLPWRVNLEVSCLRLVSAALIVVLAHLVMGQVQIGRILVGLDARAVQICAEERVLLQGREQVGTRHFDVDLLLLGQLGACTRQTSNRFPLLRHYFGTIYCLR